MANFKTHMGAGLVLGVAFVVIGLIYSLFSKPEIMAWVFLGVLLGSFLPDLDLDEGLPFQIVFGLIGASSAGFVFYELYESGRDSGLVQISFITLVVFLLVRFGAGRVFERFTEHRGMFHSIPAALVFGLLAAWHLRNYHILKGSQLILGMAVSVGYLGHLVLDEIYSTAGFNGRFLSKKSLGSALKFYSSSRITTLLFYIILFVFLCQFPGIMNTFGK